MRKVLGAIVTQILTLLSRDLVKLVAAANVVACPMAYFLMSQSLSMYVYGSTWADDVHPVGNDLH